MQPPGLPALRHEARTGVGAAVLALLAVLAAPGGAHSQTVAVEVDIVPLVQLPVAVERAEASGVPRSALTTLVSTLFGADVAPSTILETLRYVPAVHERDLRFGRDDDDFRGEARGTEGMGSYVQHLHRRGLRGRELAEAIHAELRRQGIPAGGPARGGPDRGVLERGFHPGVDDGEFLRGRGVPPGAGRGGPPAGRGEPGRGGPPDARDRDGRGGPPAGRGNPGQGGPPEGRADPDRGGPPEGRGSPGRSGPPEGRGGPPPTDVNRGVEGRRDGGTIR